MEKRLIDNFKSNIHGIIFFDFHINKFSFNPNFPDLLNFSFVCETQSNIIHFSVKDCEIENCKGSAYYSVVINLELNGLTIIDDVEYPNGWCVGEIMDVINSYITEPKNSSGQEKYVKIQDGTWTLTNEQPTMNSEYKKLDSLLEEKLGKKIDDFGLGKDALFEYRSIPINTFEFLLDFFSALYPFLEKMIPLRSLM